MESRGNMIGPPDLISIYEEMDEELSKTTCEICENLQYIINECENYEHRKSLQDKLNQHYAVIQDNNHRIKNPIRRVVLTFICIDSVPFPEKYKSDPVLDANCPALQVLHIVYGVNFSPGKGQIISRPYYYPSTCYFGVNEITSCLKDFLNTTEMRRKVEKRYDFNFFCNGEVGITSRPLIGMLMSQLEGVRFRWESTLPKHCVFPNHILFRKYIFNSLPKVNLVNPFDIIKLCNSSGKVRIVGIDFPVLNYKKLDTFINPKLDVTTPQYIDRFNRRDNIVTLRSYNRQTQIFEFYVDGFVGLLPSQIVTPYDVMSTKSNLQPNAILLRKIIEDNELNLDDWYKIFTKNLNNTKKAPIEDKTHDIIQYFVNIKKCLIDINKTPRNEGKFSYRNRCIDMFA